MDSQLIAQFNHDWRAIYHLFQYRDGDVYDADSVKAYVIHKGRIVYIVGGDFNLLRHALTNYDNLLAVLDGRADSNGWSYNYKKKIYEKINNLVNQSLYNWIDDWREQLHKKQVDYLIKTTQSSRSTAGVLKNELKALVKRVINNSNPNEYAVKLQEKYDVRV